MRGFVLIDLFIALFILATGRLAVFNATPWPGRSAPGPSRRFIGGEIRLS
jgi:hypothetical protein